MVRFHCAILNSSKYHKDTFKCAEMRQWKHSHRIILRIPSKYSMSPQLMKNLTSQNYADYTRSRITDDRTHDVSYYGPSFEWKEDQGTSHIAVLSPDGNAVSMTSSINTRWDFKQQSWLENKLGMSTSNTKQNNWRNNFLNSRFGSGVRGLKTGIIYNNGMNDFSWPNASNTYGLPPSPSNFIQPGKRPMSSMAPTIITYPNGTIALIVGASGGSRITTRIAYVSQWSWSIFKDV